MSEKQTPHAKADNGAIYRVIDALIELAAEKDAFIKKLENEIADLKKALVVPAKDEVLLFPSVQTITYPQPYRGCVHEFPQMWHGIFPPPCNKCGYQPPYNNIVTCTEIDLGAAGINLEGGDGVRIAGVRIDGLKTKGNINVK